MPGGWRKFWNELRVDCKFRVCCMSSQKARKLRRVADKKFPRWAFLKAQSCLARNHTQQREWLRWNLNFSSGLPTPETLLGFRLQDLITDGEVLLKWIHETNKKRNRLDGCHVGVVWWKETLGYDVHLKGLHTRVWHSKVKPCEKCFAAFWVALLCCYSPDFLPLFTKIFPRMFVPSGDLSCNTFCLLAWCPLLLSIQWVFVEESAWGRKREEREIK